MSGAGVRVNLAADPRILARLERLGQFDLGPLLEGIGMEVETQTRRRIQDDKAAPDGSSWPEWSAKYAKTRHSGHSLLQGEGHLQDSITYEVSGDSVLVGSPLVYAATHQFGDPARNIPQREFLGLAGQDHEDVVGLIEDYLEGIAND